MKDKRKNTFQTLIGSFSSNLEHSTVDERTSLELFDNILHEDVCSSSETFVDGVCVHRTSSPSSKHSTTSNTHAMQNPNRYEDRAQSTGDVFFPRAEKIHSYESKTQSIRKEEFTAWNDMTEIFIFPLLMHNSLSFSPFLFILLSLCSFPCQTIQKAENMHRIKHATSPSSHLLANEQLKSSTCLKYYTTLPENEEQGI